MQQCPNCGNPLPEKASFCAHCGTSLTQSDVPTSQEADISEHSVASAQEASLPTTQEEVSTSESGTPEAGAETDVEPPMDLASPSSPDLAEAKTVLSEAKPLSMDSVPSTLETSAAADASSLVSPTLDEPFLPASADHESAEALLPAQKIVEQEIEQPQTSLPEQASLTEEDKPGTSALETAVPSEERPETAVSPQQDEPAKAELPDAKQTPIEDATLSTVSEQPPSSARVEPSLADERAEEERAIPAARSSQPLATPDQEEREASTPEEQLPLPMFPDAAQEEKLEEVQRAFPSPLETEQDKSAEDSFRSEEQIQPPPVAESAPSTPPIAHSTLPVTADQEKTLEESTEKPEPSERPEREVAVSQATTQKVEPGASDTKEAVSEKQPSTTPTSDERQEKGKTAAASARAEHADPAAIKAAADKRAALADQETLLVPALKVAPGSSTQTLRRPGPQTLNELYAERSRTNTTQEPLTPSRPLSTTDTLPRPASNAVRIIGAFLWRLISPIFKRARDPEPERPVVPQPQPSLLGWLPIFALTSAFGLFTVSTAFNAARALSPNAELYYWLGLGLIYLPIVVRLIMPHASRTERVGLLLVATICLFLTKVSLSPLYFSGYDEFLHWRSVIDILNTHHLLTKNPLLPVSPFYPGLEIVTSSVSAVSGMTSIQAGFTVLGFAEAIIILSLFLLAETLSGSARLASIAAIIYMANPHYIFFDSQYAYESLALPLATVVMLTMARYETFDKHRPWLMLVAWTVLLALDLTHHATNFVFEGLFLLWALVYLFLRPLPLHKTIVTRTSLIGIALTIITVLVIGNTVIGYFGSFFTDIGSQIAKDLGSAGGTSRQLFGGAGPVIETPLWERLTSLGSVGLITLSIPFLLLCFWRRYRRNSLIWVFALVVTFYPVLQVLRLTTSGAEISDRASAFIFIPLSFLGAMAIVQYWPVRSLTWRSSAVVSVAILMLFMGGIILGEGTPAAFLPSTYLVSADARSIDAEGIQTALWTYNYLGPNKRMYTDRINQLIMGVYGDQYLVTKISDGVDLTDVIFDPTIGKYEISLLQRGQVHYLAIDLRLSTQLPQDGFYYEQGEASTGPNGDNVAINRALLTKFSTVPQINRLFDSGDFAIYDTGGLINAPPIP